VHDLAGFAPVCSPSRRTWVPFTNTPAHADGVLERFVEGREVVDLRGSNTDDVGETALVQAAAILQLEALGRQSRQAAMASCSVVTF
jgi:hypothetical protein